MGRHLDALVLSTDGPLSTAAIRAAMNADRLEARDEEKRRGCRIKWGSVKPTRHDLVGIRASKGNASIADLQARGWTQGQIQSLRHEAVPIAHRLWHDRGRA